MRIGVGLPQSRRCGIGDFARALMAAMPHGVSSRTILFPKGGSARAWRRAAAEADRLDLVHIHFEYALFDVIKPYRNRWTLFTDRLRPPVVVTLHGPLPELKTQWREGYRKPRDLLRDLAYAPFFHGWRDRMYSGVEHWIVHGRSLFEEVATMCGASRTSCIPLPMPGTAVDWRAPEGGDPIIVTPGFIKAHKGYEDFVDVLRALPGCRWVIAGGPQTSPDEIYLSGLRRTLEVSRLSDRVHITGYLDRGEMEKLVARAALAVFPFRTVTASASAAWAIACGTPVAATDLPEFRSMRDDGAGIELLPSTAPSAWPPIIDRLIYDRGRLESLAQKNRIHAAGRTVAAAALAHAKVFERVLDTAREADR